MLTKNNTLFTIFAVYSVLNVERVVTRMAQQLNEQFKVFQVCVKTEKVVNNQNQVETF
jgi:hypothetical protein